MLSTKNTYVKYSKNELQRKAPLDILNNIQMEFVVTPIEKVSRNVPFICQRFYARSRFRSKGS